MPDEVDHYGSRFLYSEDLLVGGKYISPSLEISEVFERNTIESIQKEGTFINQRAIKFKGTEKILGINHNMGRIIQHVTGEPFGEKWIGKTIKIEVRGCLIKGKLTPALRVMPVVGKLIRPHLIKTIGDPIKEEK